jgi:HrpA-like RNA helicase
MGALIKGKILNCDFNSPNVNKRNNYKSGVITTIGKIFAELPFDIKYSRLIMLSYSLGEIELGITLAAILSQERPIFLSSENVNRYNLYNSKMFYSLGKECDFITCYTAYKNWYYKVGHLLINSKIKYDTQLRFIGKEKYKEI